MVQNQVLSDYIAYLEKRAYEEAIEISLPDSVMIDMLGPAEPATPDVAVPGAELLPDGAISVESIEVDTSEIMPAEELEQPRGSDRRPHGRSSCPSR